MNARDWFFGVYGVYPEVVEGGLQDFTSEEVIEAYEAGYQEAVKQFLIARDIA